MITPTLEIIIPAYNEAKRIGKTLRVYLEYVKHLDETARIFVVINGSTDDTEAVVQKYAKLYPENLRYHVIPGRIGKGGAVVYGLANSHADYIGFVDADNSVTPRWFNTLLQRVIANPKLGGAIASRALPTSILENRDASRIRISQAFNYGVNTLFRLGFKDTQCGGKVFRKEVIKTILPKLLIANMAFDIDILYNCKVAGIRVTEVPIHWADVDGITTHNPARIAAVMALSCLELRLTHSPLRFSTPILVPLWMVLLKPADRPLRFLQKEFTVKK